MDVFAEPVRGAALLAAVPFVPGAIALLALGLYRWGEEAPPWLWGVALAATWWLGFQVTVWRLGGVDPLGSGADGALDAVTSQTALSQITSSLAGASAGAALCALVTLIAARLGGRAVPRVARTLPLALCLGSMAAVVAPLMLWLALHGAPAWAFRGPVLALVAALLGGSLIARRSEQQDQDGDALALVGALLVPLAAAWAWDSAIASAAAEAHRAHAELDARRLPELLNVHRGVRGAAQALALLTVTTGLAAAALGLFTRRPSLRSAPGLATAVSLLLACGAGFAGRSALVQTRDLALATTAEHRVQVLVGDVDLLPVPGVRAALQLTVPVAAELLISSVDGAPWRRAEDPARGARVERPLPAATRVALAAAPATPAALLSDAWTDSATTAGQLQVLVSRDPVRNLDDDSVPDWRLSAVPFDTWPLWSADANQAFWEALDPATIAMVGVDAGGGVSLAVADGPPMAMGPTFDADTALARALADSGVQTVVLATPTTWTLQELVNLCLAARGEDPATARRCALAPSLPARLRPPQAARGRRRPRRGHPGGQRHQRRGHLRGRCGTQAALPVQPGRGALERRVQLLKEPQSTMNLPPDLRGPFDALVVSPLVDVRELRGQVKAHYVQVSAEVAARGAVDAQRVADLASVVDAALAAITRKTSPLHVRLMQALALWVLRPDVSHRASRERLDNDWRVAEEVVRVIRRPHILPRH